MGKIQIQVADSKERIKTMPSKLFAPTGLRIAYRTSVIIRPIAPDVNVTVGTQDAG